MVEVSEKFKTLAQNNGRHVYCKITAGSEVFFDDRITGFDFDDVAHPDWFTLGSTCANRFYFSVEYSGDIAVGSLVRPYISFDNVEWCPLGVFYAARRYYRGNSLSIVCYDRFYSLDMKYSCGLSLPCGSDVVLQDICRTCGLPCFDYGESYTVTAIPEGATIRDMIGYIAALNFSCARFDRYGRLCLHRHDDADFYLFEKNCTDISRNITHSVITCVKADTGDGVLTAGGGAEISTLEIYNPLITQNRLDQLREMLRPLSFYGAEIEMQGLPFLEAGDIIRLVDSKGFYPIIISEIDYHYDGALYATLYSKNRYYTDAVVHEDDLANELEQLRKEFTASYLKYTNDAQIAIGTTPQDIAVFSFSAMGDNFVQLDLNFTLSDSSAQDLIIDVYVNGEQIPRRAVHHFTENGEKSLLHYYYLADGLTKGQNTISVQFSVDSGSAYILPRQFIGTIVARGVTASGAKAYMRTIYEQVEKPALRGTSFSVKGITDSMEYSANVDLTEE